MEECIFCKIINKEIPSFKIYENEFVLAFLDVNPIARGHTLVIPKRHFKDALDCEDKYLEEIIKAIKLISNHYRKVLDCTGINILNASGKSAEQSVFHTHFHIIPRFDNDGYKTWPITNYRKEDLKELSSKLRIE